MNEKTTTNKAISLSLSLAVNESVSAHMVASHRIVKMV